MLPCGAALGEGDLDVEDRAVAVVRLDPDPTIDAAHELPADVEAQARSADPARHVGIEPVELLEDPFAL